MRFSPDVLMTKTEKTTVPPGSGRLVGSATLSTSTVGRVSTMSTSARACSVTLLPSSSCAVAVMMLERTSPASPLTTPDQEQAYVAPGAMTCGNAQLPTPSSGPSTSSLSAVRVIASGEVFWRDAV